MMRAPHVRPFGAMSVSVSGTANLTGSILPVPFSHQSLTTAAAAAMTASYQGHLVRIRQVTSEELKTAKTQVSVLGVLTWREGLAPRERHKPFQCKT